MGISITTVIIIVTVIVSYSAFNNRELFYKLSYNPHAVKHDKQWYRAFTHAFVHADLMHLFLNMFVLYSFGTALENALVFHFLKIGYYYYFLLYTGAAVFATLISYMRHQDNVMYNSVGASGAVAAVLFATIIVNPDMEVYMIFFPVGIPGLLFGAIYLAAEYYMDKRGGGNVAHDAHFLGAIFGILFVIAIDYQFAINVWNKITSYF